jgi:hypothetical protein
MYLKGFCQEMREQTVGMLDEMLLSQDSWCMLWVPLMCMISHPCIYQSDPLTKKVEGFESPESLSERSIKRCNAAFA